MAEIALVHESPRPFVGIRRSVHHTKLQPYFAEVLPKVMAWVTAQGIAPTSMPMALWHAMDPETGMCDAQAGVFVAEEVAGEGEITAGVTAGGDILRLVHVGSYRDMGVSWRAVFEEAQRLGRPPGAGWEIYLDDPAEVDESALRTEISLPVGPAGDRG